MVDPARHFGLDFGTSNSIFASSEPGGRLSTFRFDVDGAFSENFPSVLHFQSGARRQRGDVTAGPWALQTYLTSGSGRFIQSVKSFVASRAFTTTRIAGQSYRIEDLIGLFLRFMRDKLEAGLGPLGDTIWAGRPVRFAGTRADEDLAIERLRAAYAQAGWTNVTFAFEPVAAAYHYCSTVEHAARVAVADFGAGTSDFSVLETQPSNREGRPLIRVLGTSGVGIAGDNFDARIVQHVIAPALGADAHYVSSDNKRLHMPRWLFGELARWHQISFLNTPENLRLIHDIQRTSDAPDKLDGLLYLIEHELGFAMYRAVSKAKMELSQSLETELDLTFGPLKVRRTVRREEFERWIDDDLKKIDASLEEALNDSGVSAGDVSHVFMTGGSSYVPAVRRLFERRFGAERLSFGDAFVSVGRGLAIMAGRDSMTSSAG